MNILETYPVKKTLILDIMNAALCIDERFASFLIAAPGGAYLKGEMEPVLAPGKEYFTFIRRSEQWNVTQGNRFGVIKADENHRVEAINWRDAIEKQKGVMDSEGKVLVPEHLSHLLTAEPTVPVTSLRIVRELVEEYLARSLHWTKATVSKEYDILAKYLRSDVVWLESISTMTAVEGKQEGIYCKQDVMEDILSYLRAIRAEIACFIGEDEWHIHFTKYYGPRALAISKSIDYRIAVFMQKMALGEWQ